jgi:hypothetical protein
MAIDTAAKRSSLIGFGVPSYVTMPASGVSDADRADLLGLYAGVALAGLPELPEAAARGGMVVNVGALMTR